MDSKRQAKGKQNESHDIQHKLNQLMAAFEQCQESQREFMDEYFQHKLQYASTPDHHLAFIAIMEEYVSGRNAWQDVNMRHAKARMNAAMMNNCHKNDISNGKSHRDGVSKPVPEESNSPMHILNFQAVNPRLAELQRLEDKKRSESLKFVRKDANEDEELLRVIPTRSRSLQIETITDCEGHYGEYKRAAMEKSKSVYLTGNEEYNQEIDEGYTSNQVADQEMYAQQYYDQQYIQDDHWQQHDMQYAQWHMEPAEQWPPLAPEAYHWEQGYDGYMDSEQRNEEIEEQGEDSIIKNVKIKNTFEFEIANATFDMVFNDIDIERGSNRGIHCVVKNGEYLYLDTSYINLSQIIAGKESTTSPSTQKPTLPIQIDSVLVNCLHFKSSALFYFLEDGRILAQYDDGQQQKVCLLPEVFGSYYTVGGHQFLSTSRGLRLGGNVMYIINKEGKAKSLDLVAWTQLDELKRGQMSFGLEDAGPVTDIAYSSKNLFLLMPNGHIVRRLKEEVPNTQDEIVYKTRQTDFKFMKIPKDTEFSSLTCSTKETLITGYSRSTATTSFVLLTDNLKYKSSYFLECQDNHVHTVKLLIRKKVSHFIAATTDGYLHILISFKLQITPISLGIKVSNKLDGICVVNEHYILLYEGITSVLKLVELRKKLSHK